MTATQLTDTIQAIATLTLALGLIFNSVRIHKLTQNVRSPFRVTRITRNPLTRRKQ